MKVPREAWWLAGLLGLMCVVGLVLGGDRGEPAARGLADRTSYSNGPSGLRALYLTLQDLHYEVRRLRAPFARAVLPERGVLVVVQPTTPIAGTEWEALRRWAARGRTVILAGDEGLPLGGAHLPAAEWSGEEPRQTSAWACQPTYLAAGARRLAVRSHLRLEVPQLPAARKPGKTKADESPWVEPSPAPLREDLGRAVPVFRDKRGTVAAYARLGRGRVILLSSPWSLSNEGIAGQDNLIFALNALGPPAAGPVYFDEYHHGYGENLFWGLVPVSLKVALGSAVLGLLLVIYARSRRFGPVLPLERGARQRSEFLGTMTALLRKGRATRLAVRTAHDAAVEQLRRELRLPGNAGTLELSRAAGRVNAEAGEKLLAALRRCRGAWEAPGGLGEARAMALVRELDQALRLVHQI